jgi:hypothetical protein
MVPSNAVLPDGPLCQQVAAVPWGDALVAGGTSSADEDLLGSQLFAHAVAQPLLADMLALRELPHGPQVACPNDTSAYARPDRLGEAPQEPCVDVSLMGSLIDEVQLDVNTHDTDDSPGWVQDWLRELTSDGC